MNTQNQVVTEGTPDFNVFFSYGEVLDAVEAGESVLSPQSYWALSRLAKEFIISNWQHPDLASQCERAGALQDIYENVLFEARHQRTATHLLKEYVSQSV